MRHLDCTTEERRIQICKDYEVHADACIVLYGDRTIRSDANNRIIEDRYYQFFCKGPDGDYIITCGSGAARHLCMLIGEPMPRSFDPFIRNNQESVPNNNQGLDMVNNNQDTHLWNRARHQLYFAIQLFITRYQTVLSPGTSIFDLLHNVSDERYIHIPPRDFMLNGFISIVRRFNTDIPTIINELAGEGRLRHFEFNELALMVDDENNIFTH